MEAVLSAGDLLTLPLPDWSGDAQGLEAESFKQAGDTIEDALDGLHNNGLTPFAAHHQRQLSGGQDGGGGGGGPGTAPSSIAPSSMTAMQSCDIDLLDVSELPANPPHSAAAPVSAPPPGLLSAEAMAGIPVYAEPSHFNPAALHGHPHHPHHLPPARGLPLLAGMGHFHHAGGLHPALAHPTAQHLHAAGLAHPGMAAFHQPLLGSPAMVLTRAGAAAQGLATQHAAAAVAAAAAQHAAAAQAQQQQQAQQPAAGPAPIATQAAPGSHTSSGGGAPGSPSFLQAALAIIKSDADRLSGGSNCPSGGHHRSGSSGEDPTSGNLASLGSGGAGAGSPRSAFAAPAAAGVAGLPGAAAGSPFAAMMGLAALQPVAVQQAAGPGSPTGARGARPQRQAAQNAATILTKAGSEALSVQDDDEQGSYTDDQATPRGGRKGKGATRPRSNAAYDALIDPNLPPEEARRMRRMLSNRESARRSRRRRQSHLTTLETQVEQLKSEKERLEGELSSAGQQMRAVVAEKQRLQLEVEALRRRLAQMGPTDAGAGMLGLGLPPAHPPAQQPGSMGSGLPLFQQQAAAPQDAQQQAAAAAVGGADDLQQDEWSRFGVSLGGLSTAGAARPSLDGGRKVARPPSLQNIHSSMEQMMTKKNKDSSGGSQSPPTVLEGLPGDLLHGGAFGALC